MTEHNNSNADGERPNPTPNNGDPGSADFDAAWAQFAAEHAEDLNDVERSRNAKRFEKHAQRKEKEALLSVDDLDPAAFAGGAAFDSMGGVPELKIREVSRCGEDLLVRGVFACSPDL